MKLSAPGSLRLDREQLLQDVYERLADRMPGLDGEDPDPTDPGWLLIEQATWLAEQLSAELDRYPVAVLQQFLHLVGARLQPAVPPLAVAVLQPREAGMMRTSQDRPAPWRFFTPQTETRDPIEFVPAEPVAPVCPMEVGGIWHWNGIQLFNVTGARPNEGNGAAGSVVPFGTPERSAVFDRQRVEYRLIATEAEALLEKVQEAIGKLNKGGAAWLVLEAARLGDNEVVISAQVDPIAALRRAAGGDVTPGGDLRIEWEPIEGSTWTPPVRFSNNPRLPHRLRGTEPMPGSEDGTLLIRNLPAGIALTDVLVTAAAPLSRPVVDAIWGAIQRLDARLAGLRPQVDRGFHPTPDRPTPSWIAATLQASAWPRLAGNRQRSFCSIRAFGDTSKDRLLRCGLLWNSPVDIRAIEAWALVGGAVADEPSLVREAWTLPVPAGGDREGLEYVQAIDIFLPAGQEELVLALPGPPRACMPNAVMVINAPLVPDGREVVVERAVPEGVSLLEENIVGTDVLQSLLQQPIGQSTRALLAQLPLARFQVASQPPIDDYEGITLDSCSGQLTLNGPDEQGVVRDFRPETVLTLEWYRRTDGSIGEVEAGAIRFVEQAPSTRPRINGCTNPAGAWFGSSRETEIEARDRMFSPTSDLPVVPGDWERLIQRELGPRARGWVIRCWGHAERSLISTRCWPLDDPDADPETRRFRAATANAGPDTLTVVLGPKDGVLSLADLDAARRSVNALVQRVRRRLPAIQQAEVTRLWPLVLETTEADADPPLPCFTGPELNGELVAPDGARCAPPQTALMLNAAVVKVLEVVQ